MSPSFLVLLSTQTGTCDGVGKCLFADFCAFVFSCSPHAAHMHPPPQPGQMPPPGPPGALPGQNDPTEPLDMQRMNSMYLAAKDGRMDRLEADSRGYHSVYAA